MTVDKKIIVRCGKFGLRKLLMCVRIQFVIVAATFHEYVYEDQCDGRGRSEKTFVQLLFLCGFVSCDALP